MTEAIVRPDAHPRVIRIPATSRARASKEKWPVLLPNLGRGALVLLLLLLLWNAGQQIWNTAHYTQQRFDIRPRLLRIPEAERIAHIKSERAGAVLAYKKAYAADPQGLLLAFPQADQAYYGSAPYLSYFDAAALPLFKITTPRALWEALHTRNVRYVLRPPFPLPELNNSSFDTLLADPQFTEIAFEQGGARLLRILPDIAPTQGKVLYSEGVSDHRMRIADWSIVTPTPPTNSGTSKLSQSAEGDLRVSFPTDLLRDRNRLDFIERGHPVNGAQPAFRAPLGRLRITMDVTGRGRFDVLAVNLTKDRAAVVDTSVWSGVLLGNRRIISGQFFTPVDAAFDADGLRPMGLTLWGFRAKDLTIHSWKVEWFPATGDTASAPKAAAEQSATPPTSEASPVTIAYLLHQPVDADMYGVDALLAANEIHARLDFGAIAGQTPESAVICLNGRKREIMLAQIDGMVTGELPCWPRALSVKWPAGQAPAAAPRAIIRMDRGEERTVPFTALSDALSPPTAGANP